MEILIDLMKHHYQIKAFYSELYLKDITGKDYTHAQKLRVKKFRH